ncbi:ABC transporter substrate-binding protein [Micromonospora sp. GCM10011542]|uniref:ABC transporter substrate-binding protein n=1 Tax=Micromonospora sp. GCM10011542 TaxID=3317337 RepID=UPI00360EA9DC
MACRVAAVLAWLTLSVVASSCGIVGPADDRVRLDFFQFKPEAIATFDRIIADFEREHPDINVVQNHVPNADTALRTRLVRDDIPDVLTLNAGATYSELASAGVFYDFADQPVTATINPGILTIINDLGTGGPDEVNGIPFANNADGVLYNKDLFARYDVEVPRTWDELIRAARTFQAAGVQPFYGTLKDSWTILPAWNALSAYLPPPRFFDDLRADRTSFRQGYPPVAQRLKQLFDLAQPDRLSRGYNDGNQAFAKGEVAMYLQGSWAIPVVREFKPGFEIGLFPMPADDPARTALVSGVDVALTMGREPEHEQEALEFINYVMRPEVVTAYAKDQSAVPPLRDSAPADPALADVLPYFVENRVVGFADHRVPPAIPLDKICQQYLIDGDEAAYLSTLDNEWDKVARRRA